MASPLGIECDEVIHSILDVMYANAPYTVIQRVIHIYPAQQICFPGIVSPKDVDPSGHLVVTWHSFNLVAIDNTTQRETVLSEPTVLESESTFAARIGPYRRKFAVGKRISFNRNEHKHTIFTFYVFALEIMQALEKRHPENRDGVAKRS